ncbi:glycosyltransferase family 4 protein [Pseudonocardia abyssalis]|uniref:Glycosyltransferase family 4 protein n=1 Tax=Pseudonocardia abyssalis TaxID=2792008 RepID=A0ABS6UVK3_9PSEU|nr:glycosyltransferase family 1 protein [Pseudonocardia abyssalis]MBW0114575.1 glycosyltransferase family 4 protein [Pseudonocardia abyssalis]MBW0135734.1 glycosyltransferase family 4 protein [Pseudonocardia abyssalis]
MMSALRYLLMAGHVPESGSGGGIVRYTVELARALARCDDVELHLMVDGRSPVLEALVPATHVLRRPTLPTALRSLHEWQGPGQSAGVDVVHGVKHIVPVRSSGAAKVLTVHDMLLLDRPGDFSVVKRVLLRRPYLASIHDADLVLCVSAATRARLLDYVPSAADKAVVVPLAAPSSLDDAVPVPVPELVGRRFALVVGDSNPRKNLRLAVDTWSQVRERVGDAVLVVVGPPEWAAAARGTRWAEHLDSGAVQHLGQVPDGTLRWCYEHASVVLCPSRLEGFGLPAVEAIRFGAPLVVSDDPALGEAGAGSGAVVVAGRDKDGWVRAVVTALANDRRASASTRDREFRNWDDVAAATVRAVRGAVDACRS